MSWTRWSYLVVAQPNSHSVTHADIRQDLLDAYLYIQRDLTRVLASGSQLQAQVDVTQCILAGASAGGTGVLFLAADIEAYKADPSRAGQDLPSPGAVLAAYPVTDCNAMWTAPRSALEAYIKEHRPEVWEETAKLYDQKVSCSDPYQDNVM